MYSGYGEARDACQSFLPCNGPNTTVTKINVLCLGSSPHLQCLAKVFCASLHETRVHVVNVTIYQEVYRGADWLDAPNHYPNLSHLHDITILEEYETSYPSDPSTHSLAVALVSFFILLSAGLLLFVFATPELKCHRKCYRRVLGQSTDRSSSSSSPNSAREDEEQSEVTSNPLASTDAPRRGFGGIVTRTPTSIHGEHHEESASPPGERGTFEFEMTSPGGGLIII